MMRRPAAFGLLITPMLVLAEPVLALDMPGQSDADTSLSASEREAMEARVQQLKRELTQLQSQLDADSSSISASQPPASVQERHQLERESESNPFAITTHHRNYILPISYNQNPNEEPFKQEGNGKMDNAEVKFQFSAKFGIAEDLLFDNGDLFFAYTQRSWWQAYNSEESAPFRETNYEPEVFLDFENSYTLWGWTNTNNRIAFNHQSNGRTSEYSRSWNRFILTSTWVHDDWTLVVAPYWRIPEDSEDDDNPDIEHYVGYGDITIAHQLFDDHEASLTMRGNPGDGNYGGQFDYSWPLFGKVRGHIQYYNGYGESLIDYNARTNRLGIGFSLNPLFPSSDRNGSGF